MRLMLCALAVSALSFGAASAGETPSADQKATNAAARTAPARAVYICDSSPETRRGFTREFGQMDFVTADEATAKGQAWSAPKCVTSREAARLKEAAR